MGSGSIFTATVRTLSLFCRYIPDYRPEILVAILHPDLTNKTNVLR